jgi:hypothetical protein
MKHFPVYLLIALIVASCSATRDFSAEIMRPAEITLPVNVKRVGLLNRSVLSAKQYLAFYNDDSLEMQFPDIPELGADMALDAFADRMNGFGRFEMVKLKVKDTADRKDGYIALPLSWDQARAYASENNIQAIVALEGYDANVYTNGQVSSTAVTTENGVVINYPYFTDKRTIIVTTVWRIYNIDKQVIASEKTENSELSYTREGFNRDKTYNSLPDKRGSVENTSQVGGIRYADRIIPYWQPIDRRYYTGFSSAWQDAADSADVKNWKSAAEQWEKLLKQSKLKVMKMQAYYNLSVAYEMLEQFDKALVFAESGAKNFGKAEFNQRIAALLNRRSESELLDVQFGVQKK